MPKQIDKIRKAKYKVSRLQGNSIVQSLRNSGYSEGVARKSSFNGVVKVSEQELMNEFKASNISVEWVIEQLTQELTQPDCKASDRIRVKELLGKYLNMFKDTQIQQISVFNDPKLEEDARVVINDATTSNSKG